MVFGSSCGRIVDAGTILVGCAVFLVIVTVFIGLVVTIIIIIVVIHSCGDVMCIYIIVV